MSTTLQEQYLTDREGKRVGVVLDMEQFERIVEELEDLQTGDYERVRDAIARLAGDPRPAGCVKLT